MSAESEVRPTIGGNEGFERGLTVEHVMLSVTVISTKKSCGQFDDSCAYQLKKALYDYAGVKEVRTQVLYNHTKIEQHANECQCGYCNAELSAEELEKLTSP
jgi:hypothetical protein